MVLLVLDRIDKMTVRYLVTIVRRIFRIEERYRTNKSVRCGPGRRRVPKKIKFDRTHPTRFVCITARKGQGRGPVPLSLNRVRVST